MFLRDAFVIAATACTLVVSAAAPRAMRSDFRIREPDTAIELLARGFEQFRSRTGRLPTTEAMVLAAELYADQWGHPLIVERHDGGVKIVTYGRDAWPGGDGDDRDLELWLVTCDNASCPDTCNVCGR